MMAMVMMRLVAMLQARHQSVRQRGRVRQYAPSCHAPQRLDAPIRVALALEQHLARVGDLLALAVQIAQRAGANLLRLERNTLRLAQPPRRPVQPVGA